MPSEAKSLGLLSVPRTADDLWLIPRIWKGLTVGLFLFLLATSRGLPADMVEGLLLGTSGWALLRILRSHRDARTPALPSAPDQRDAFALAELRDLVAVERLDAGRSLGRGFLLSVAPAFFGAGSLMTLGLLGSNQLGLSPLPWLAAFLVTTVPPVYEFISALSAWRLGRRLRNALRELERTPVSAAPSVPTVTE